MELIKEENVTIEVSCDVPKFQAKPKLIMVTLPIPNFRYCPSCGQSFDPLILNPYDEPDEIKGHIADCLKSTKGWSMKVTETTSKATCCPTCGKKFANKRTLDKHRFFCDPNLSLAEYNLPPQQANEDIDLKPKVKVNKRPKAECPVCHKIFNQKAYLANHMNIHTGNRPYKCKYCTKGFKDYSGLRNHHLSHEDIKAYTCDEPECDKAFRRADDLKKHKLKHLGIKPHICSFCAKAFRTLSTMKAHELKQHGDATEQDQRELFYCQDCNDVFKSKSGLRDHEIRIHGKKGSELLKCDFEGCVRDFTNPALLRNHRRTHTDERPFSCPYCECKFKAKFHMMCHAQRHTKNGQYLCLECAQGFPDPGLLKEHAKTSHTLEDLSDKMKRERSWTLSYACAKCNKKFVRADLLNDHFKTHQQQSFPCDKCHKKFITIKLLQDHVRVHHDHFDDVEDIKVNVDDFMSGSRDANSVEIIVDDDN
jgi:KRAB domain-containing zinc finger protein